MSQIFISDFGAKSARPVVFFHGFPGSHHQGWALQGWADRFQLRLLCPDRPGYGHSEPSRAGLLEFARDLIETLAQKYSVNKAYLLGVSGGNPAAMTTAAVLGPKALGLASVAGLIPFSDPVAAESFTAGQTKALNTARRLPRPLLAATLLTLMKGFDPETGLKAMVDRLPPRDQQALKQPGFMEATLQSLALARRQGPAGLIFDLKTFTSPWPFRWSDITCPVSIWHGQGDRVLSPTMAKYLQARLPRAKMFELPDEGHYSLPILRAEEILQELVGEPPR